MLMPYKPEPYLDFSISENRAAMESALKKVEGELGRHYPLVINGKPVSTKDKITSINPSDTSQVVGTVGKASEKDAENALQAALTAFEEWKKVPWEARARYLIAIAKKMRERRLELSAWMVYEEGKNWLEALADTSEAIDFHEFYAREAIRLGGVAGTHEVTPFPD